MTNEDAELVRATVERARMAYPVALTPGSDADAAYGVRAVPKAFLVDRAGTIAWSGHPAELDEALLRRLLDG